MPVTRRAILRSACPYASENREFKVEPSTPREFEVEPSTTNQKRVEVEDDDDEILVVFENPQQQAMTAVKTQQLKQSIGRRRCKLKKILRKKPPMANEKRMENVDGTVAVLLERQIPPTANRKQTELLDLTEEPPSEDAIPPAAIQNRAEAVAVADAVLLDRQVPQTAAVEKQAELIDGTGKNFSEGQAHQQQQAIVQPTDKSDLQADLERQYQRLQRNSADFHKSQQIAQPKRLERPLLQRYPVVWQGCLALKDRSAKVQLNFVSGCPGFLVSSLPERNENSPVPVLRIAGQIPMGIQFMRKISKKMQNSGDHCVMLVLPCGDKNCILEESNILNTSIITYLWQRQVAGIVQLNGALTQQGTTMANPVNKKTPQPAPAGSPSAFAKGKVADRSTAMLGTSKQTSTSGSTLSLPSLETVVVATGAPSSGQSTAQAPGSVISQTLKRKILAKMPFPKMLDVCIKKIPEIKPENEQEPNIKTALKERTKTGSKKSTGDSEWHKMLMDSTMSLPTPIPEKSKWTDPKMAQSADAEKKEVGSEKSINADSNGVRPLKIVLIVFSVLLVILIIAMVSFLIYWKVLSPGSDISSNTVTPFSVGTEKTTRNL